MNKIFLFLTFLFPGGLLFSQSLEVIRTTCEYRDNPLGIEVSSPALGWQLGSEKRGVVQTAYRILVSDQPGLLNKQVGNIWDSKIVYSSASLQVPYKGKKLLPAKTYYWKVQVWDQNKKASAWSETAFWQMGLLSQIDWKGARWIGLEAMPDSVKMVPAQHQRGDPRWWNVKDVLPLLRKK